MILVTGGAGFIGSNLHAALFAAGREAVINDLWGQDEKWRNLRHHPPLQIIEKWELRSFLEKAPELEAIVHLGAISETTATDAEKVWRNNVVLSQRLWRWCAEHGVTFIYASSAATYGDGSAGFTRPFTSLEEGIGAYVRDYLRQADPYR